MPLTEINDLIEPLWSLWRGGQRPDVDAFLAKAGALSPAQIAAALRVDQRERWESGERVPAENYLGRHPSVRADVEAALDLIFNECLIRERLGEQPDIDEFVGRFPEHARSLRDQMELHRAMARGPTMNGPSLDGSSADERETMKGCAADPFPLLPEEFGRYRIRNVIGRGGMGTVYHAHDTQLDRAVALKVPHFGEGVNEAVLIRFHREARIAATLAHPHLCPVFDVGEFRGTHYLTMPLLSGEPLSAWLRRRGPQPTAVAARMTAQVARALQFAHNAGVIHRDLKPANILVQRDSEFIVMDFGLARRAGPRDPSATRSGVLIGTPAYLPPEQIGGDSAKSGPASDIYSLGVILYEVLTGRAPFVGTTDEVLRQVLAKDPDPVFQHRPDVDPRLEKICRTAMAKDAKDRFASMAAFADALDDVARSPTAMAQLAESDAPAVRLPKPSRRAWPVLAFLGVFALGTALAAVAFSRRGPTTAEAPRDALQPGSRWEGAFRFGPPPAPLNDVSIAITNRAGNQFTGEYATESGAYRWRIAGTVNGSDIRWKFTEVIKEATKTGVVESASVEGKLTGDAMTVNYRDDDSAVTIELFRK